MTNGIHRALLSDKLSSICKQTKARGWEGPKFTAPEDTLEHQQRFGTPIRPKWELWMEKPGVPNSYPPHEIGQPIRAAVYLTDTEVANLTGEVIAFRLAAAVAGREAHEALEWFWFERQRVADPHGDLLGLVAEGVANYLRTAT